MRKKLLIVLCGLAISMVGCSNSEKNTLAVTGGTIYNNGVATTVVEHTGNTARLQYALDANLTIEFDKHKSFGDCDHNMAGVVEADVTKLEKNKKISYFSAYQGSQYTIHKDMGDYLVCGYLYSADSLQADVAINQLELAIETLELSDSYGKAVMEGVIEVNNFPSIKLTPTSVSIPGELSVLKGTVDTTEVREINKQNVGFMSDGAYDYYVYNGYTVKCLKGYDVAKCVKFLKQ